MQARVEKITWLSESAKEAEVVLSSQEASLIAFCHPCELEFGTLVTSPIHVFGATKVMLAQGDAHSIVHAGGQVHLVTGNLVDLERQLVTSCGFVFTLDDHLPGGLATGDTISFRCRRLDIWWRA